MTGRSKGMLVYLEASGAISDVEEIYGICVVASLRRFRVCDGVYGPMVASQPAN